MAFIQNLFGVIDPIIFMVSFCVGLFFTYSLTSAPEILYLYPNPHNVKDTIYKDDSEKCFKYMSEKVECTDDAIDIEKVNGSKVNNIDYETFIVRRS
jgi:hypothetical protein